MRSKEEIEKKLSNLLEVRKQRTPPEREPCKTCGQTPPFMSSWTYWDHAYLDAEIESLKWVLGLTEHLMENHT